MFGFSCKKKTKPLGELKIVFSKYFSVAKIILLNGHIHGLLCSFQICHNFCDVCLMKIYRNKHPDDLNNLRKVTEKIRHHRFRRKMRIE